MEGKQNVRDFLPIDEAARLVDLSHWTIRVWLHKGRLTRYKCGARAQLDSQIASSALQNLMMSLAQKKDADGQTRFENARVAATDAWKWAGNPILGAIVAPLAFASVMAFEKGGIVPGAGVGDTVPAMLTPGEFVLPKAFTESLTNAAKFGNVGDSGPDVHIHYHHTSHVQAFDSTGVDKVLQQHGDKFIRHATNHLRKMNL
jgi:hypothetical protein